jgi:transcriptional regulator with XRE-family HTH domain
MNVDEKQFGRQVTSLRKRSGMTQDELAARLHVSAQAVSKWENGHSLPETALLPQLAKVFGVMIDELFGLNDLIILEALFGDGISAVNVTKRLNRLLENDELAVTASASLLGAGGGERAAFLTVKYQTPQGICHAVFPEDAEVHLTACDIPLKLPEAGLEIVAGCYGTGLHHYDVMKKINHYKPFGWNAYNADHETFPSDPANDQTEYLTLVYLNSRGIHIATCAERESLVFTDDRSDLFRQRESGEYCLPHVPKLPPFGSGMECSWAAALTAALQLMGVDTDYTDVMGASGACWRLAFSSPQWDYSSVDGLVAYDYATPGYAAYGYTHELYGHIEKEDRTEHRTRIMKELRSGMPVLGINLRVAAEWGVICGYREDDAELLCRTKYDLPTIENDPEFMADSPEFDKDLLGPYETMRVDNWPFLLCYFTGKIKPPSDTENLAASLRVFIDCAAKTHCDGYAVGFEAYRTWASDLRDEAFYVNCEDELLARRFSVNQFCTLSLFDARKAARDYLLRRANANEAVIGKIAAVFTGICAKAEAIHTMLDSGEALDGPRARVFWSAEKRLTQADLLDEMAALEREALTLAEEYLN